MNTARSRAHFLAFVCFLASFNASALENPNEPTFDEFVSSLEKHEGFVPFYWDAGQGKVWLEINRWNEEFLYVPSLQTGVGSNPIGLDRGLLGLERVLKFVQIGTKVLLVEPNQRFRAQTDDASEQQAVEDSFAQSVHWGFVFKKSKGHRVLVDATAFLLRDPMNIGAQMAESENALFKIDESRSAIHRANTKNFPNNTEFEATVTFAGTKGGAEIRSVSPSSDAITVRIHHSLVRLPPPGYSPRPFDPRAGTFIGASFLDYASPIDSPIRQRYIARHRLEKRNPQAAVSDAVAPIIYYIDPGVPEPIKSALIDGAKWWEEAFEAIGYRNAFQVRELPPEADPMDVRYNIIQWVHRATRGWSYGLSVVDPRTGEIIKGKVSLGSLRVRQDYLIAQGLLSPFEAPDSADPRLVELALARLRQLSAHEVGHTLGFSHNFAASANDRSSVMDYPHPVVRLTQDGEIDLSDAYAVGIGSWDKVTVAYAYQHFPDGTNESIALNSLLENARSNGHVYITDQDARPLGGAHPDAHLWDNGSDPIDELNRVIKIRDKALRQISQASIRHGEPLATIEEVLVPIFLFHRYQTESTIKLIGGLSYEYSVRGSRQPAPKIIDHDRQIRALAAVIQTIQPEFLEIPFALIEIIPPRPPGYPRSRETFQSRMDVGFDPLSAAEAAAEHTLAPLFNVQRANRLVLQKARNTGTLGFQEFMKRIIDATWKSTRSDGIQAEIQKIIEHRILEHLFRLAVAPSALPESRAITLNSLERLKSWITAQLSGASTSVDWAPHYQSTLKQLEAFEKNPSQFKPSPPSRIPDGSPIGSIDANTCCHFQKLAWRSPLKRMSE